LEFSERKILVNDEVEHLKFFCRQIVLRYGDVGLAGPTTGPVGEAHVGFAGIGTFGD